jgi:hypothetical protein
VDLQLVQGVTRGERNSLLIIRVPSRYNQPTTFGRLFQVLVNLPNLVYSQRRGQRLSWIIPHGMAPPKRTVNWPQIAFGAFENGALLGCGPFIPNRYALASEFFLIARSRKKPEKFLDNSPEKYPLCCQKRESGHTVTPLATENRKSTDTGAVLVRFAIFDNVIKQIKITAHYLPPLTRCYPC